MNPLDIKETYCGFENESKQAEFWATTMKWKSRVRKWKEKYPDEVDIRITNDDGSMLVYIPVKWFRIAPPPKSGMTDEQKLAASERLKAVRNAMV